MLTMEWQPRNGMRPDSTSTGGDGAVKLARVRVRGALAKSQDRERGQRLGQTFVRRWIDRG